MELGNIIRMKEFHALLTEQSSAFWGKIRVTWQKRGLYLSQTDIMTKNFLRSQWRREGQDFDDRPNQHLPFLHKDNKSVFSLCFSSNRGKKTTNATIMYLPSRIKRKPDSEQPLKKTRKINKWTKTGLSLQEVTRRPSLLTQLAHAFVLLLFFGDSLIIYLPINSYSVFISYTLTLRCFTL